MSLNNNEPFHQIDEERKRRYVKRNVSNWMELFGYEERKKEKN
jgi:hypothetical protein